MTTASAYRKLKPIMRRFVEGCVAGEMGTNVIRRLRPHLKRPDVLASKWLARADVQAAIVERSDGADRRVLDALAAIERRLATIEASLGRGASEAIGIPGVVSPGRPIQSISAGDR